MARFLESMNVNCPKESPCWDLFFDGCFSNMSLDHEVWIMSLDHEEESIHDIFGVTESWTHNHCEPWLLTDSLLS